MAIEVFPDSSAAAAACAEWIADRLRDAVDARETARVAFSGGSTPQPMLADLARADVDWPRVHVFQVDERAVREEDRDRNLRLLREHFLAALDLPAGNLHPMPVGLPSLDAAARRYERTVREVCGRPARLDVVHLGLGDDGHTASLFPGDPVLVEDEDDVAAVGPYRGHRRLTLTVPMLRRAHHQAWLVSGTAKARALGELRSARGVAGAVVTDRAAVFADRAAAEP